MTYHHPYHLMNPLPGISPAHETATGYCHASPSGDWREAGNRLSYKASAPNGAVDIHRTQTATAPYSSFYIHHSSLSFTFSAKEKDSETGLSYFGSRYYSSDLGIWLSVDPQASKYPSLSPYVYCADNPVRCVDPNGEEIGEYRDWNGNLLGTDGYKDLNVFFVSDEESINIIKNNNTLENGKTNRSDVKVDWETNKIAIYSIVLVYTGTVNNGGDREEAATFFGKNKFPLFYPTGDDTGEIEIAPRGYLSIHSHKLHSFKCPDGEGNCVQTPYDLSPKDKIVFKNYVYNVVVGNSYESVANFTTGAVYEKRLGTAVIYDSSSNKIGEILIDNLRNIRF